MEKITLKAALHPRFAKIIGERPDVLWHAKNFSTGPVHLIIPEILAENARSFQDVLSAAGVSCTLYFAHKPVRSKAFLRQARCAGISIDVASENELIAALASGFVGSMIECTGSKNRPFILLAVLHQCLISIDSLDELRLVEEISSATKREVKVLLRVSSLDIKDRVLIKKKTRFGLSEQDIDEAFLILKNSTTVSFEGFHYHGDERQADIKAGHVDALLELMEESYAHGLAPTVINMGGGWRTSVFEDVNAWPRFVECCEERVKNNMPSEGWRSYAFGLSLNDKRVVVGREKLLAKFSQPDYTQVIHDTFSNSLLRGRKLSDIAKENCFRFMVEPGWLLVRNAGISLITITSVKKMESGEFLVTVNAHMYNLGVQMSELWVDPILVPKHISPEPVSTVCYIAGNLCRDEDMLYRRRIYFPQIPRTGDVIVLPNTAAYNSSFEDAAPHQHQTGVTLVVNDRNGEVELVHEDVYNPWRG